MTNRNWNRATAMTPGYFHATHSKDQHKHQQPAMMNPFGKMNPGVVSLACSYALFYRSLMSQVISTRTTNQFNLSIEATKTTTRAMEKKCRVIAVGRSSVRYHGILFTPALPSMQYLNQEPIRKLLTLCYIASCLATCCIRYCCSLVTSSAGLAFRPETVAAWVVPL